MLINTKNVNRLVSDNLNSCKVRDCVRWVLSNSVNEIIWGEGWGPIGGRLWEEVRDLVRRSRNDKTQLYLL